MKRLKKHVVGIFILTFCLFFAACGTKGWIANQMGGIEKPDWNITSAASVSGGVKYQFSNVPYNELALGHL